MNITCKYKPASARINTGLLLSACLILGLVPTGSIADTLALGATINGSSWKGDNGSGNSSFESDDGGQFAFSLHYRKDKFYSGLNLQGGEYSFGSDAPAQFTSLGNVFPADVKVEHSDFDLLFGYYLWDRVSLFLDIKAVTSEWRDNGYKQSFGGLGFGVTGYHIINSKWLLFGSLGFINGGIEDNDVSSLGDGSSRALVGGAVYQVDHENTLNFGIKLRNYDFDYDDGSRQEYTLNGVFFGYNHVFQL